MMLPHISPVWQHLNRLSFVVRFSNLVKRILDGVEWLAIKGHSTIHSYFPRDIGEIWLLHMVSCSGCTPVEREDMTNLVIILPPINSIVLPLKTNGVWNRHRTS